MTLIMDSSFARRWRWSRAWTCTVLVFVVFLLSLPNCTRFGYFYLEGMDQWINNVGLVFAVWAECVSATTIYRFEDAVSQVGMPAFATYNAAFFGAQLLSLIVGHSVSVAAGAGVGFGVFAIGSVIAVFISKTPDVQPNARLFKKGRMPSIIYYLAFYSVSFGRISSPILLRLY
jgi:solute carrier family 6 GABA transporter-like protein 1